MELKDLVQEVLGEIAKTESSEQSLEEQKRKVEEIQNIFAEDENLNQVLDEAEQIIIEEQNKLSQDSIEEEILQEPSIEKPSSFTEEEDFLLSLKERLLVLFEGFQSPNNQAVEAKLDLTLNFLEYLLARIENRLDELQSKE